MTQAPQRPKASIHQDRLPPHDLEAEESVLGALLIDPEAVAQVATLLRPEHFFRDRNRHVYDACLALFRRGAPTDQVTVAHQLAADRHLDDVGGPGYLSHLQAAVPTSLHAVHYARIVRKLADWRAVCAGASRLLTLAYDGHGEPGEAVSAAMSELSRAVTGGERKGLVSAREAAGDAWTRWHELTNPELADEPPVSTGLKDLDAYVGGFVRRRYWILGGRPSMGKTSLANLLMHNVARQGRPVLCVTLEEPDEDLELKEALRTAAVDEAAVRARRGRATPQEDSAVLDAVDQQSRLPVEYVDESGVTTADVDAYIGLAKARHPGLLLVVLDHIGHLADARERGMSEAAWTTGVSKALLNVARKHNVAMLALSQLNRQSEQRGGDFRPRLADLRESGALEQDAHVVLLAYRQDYYEERRMLVNPDSKARGTLEVIVAKQRSGPVGPVRFAWQAGPQRILPLAREAA